MYERVQAVAKVQQYHECFQMDKLSVLHVDLGINSLEGIVQCTNVRVMKSIAFTSREETIFTI